MRWTGQLWPGSEPEQQGRLGGQGHQLTHSCPTQSKACAYPPPGFAWLWDSQEAPQRTRCSSLLPASARARPLLGLGGWPCVYTGVPICLGTGSSGRGHGRSNTEPRPRCLDIRPRALVLCLILVWVPRGGPRCPVATFLVCTLSPAQGGLGPEVPRCPLGAVGQDSLGPGGQHTSPVPWPCSRLRPWGLSSQMPT